MKKYKKKQQLAVAVSLFKQVVHKWNLYMLRFGEKRGSIFEEYLNLLNLLPDFILSGAVKKKLNH